MRVSLDARSLSAAVLRGWDRYTVGLAGELVRQGVDLTLFHQTAEPPHSPHISGLDCEVVGLDEDNLIRWEQWALPRALRRGKFDLYHAPAEHGVPLWSPCPVLLTIHSATGHSFKDLIGRGELSGRVEDYLGAIEKPFGFSSWYMWAQFRRARHVFTPSEFCRDEVIRFLGIAPDRVTTTPLAVHEQFERPPSSAEFSMPIQVKIYLGVRSS